MTWNRLKASLPLLGLGLALHASTAFANATRLTFADVENIALQHFPGAAIHQIERDNELGRAAFEVDLRTAEGIRRELRVDANDGIIVSDHEDN